MSHPAPAIAGFYDHEEQTERRAPDWGGDDLFTTAPPRRRRGHTSHPPRRRDGGDGHVLPRDRGDDGRWHDADPQRDPVPEPRDADRYLKPVPAGRRTVTITGRPESLAVTRRPARTIDERIAHRPERIASWTCALGFLLILLAIVTAQ